MDYEKEFFGCACDGLAAGHISVDIAKAGPISAPLLAQMDQISFQFKTEAKNGIIFFSGKINRLYSILNIENLLEMSKWTNKS